jgi:hypothetical protein
LTKNSPFKMNDANPDIVVGAARATICAINTNPNWFKQFQCYQELNHTPYQMNNGFEEWIMPLPQEDGQMPRQLALSQWL